jgi:hypothetical protein
VVLLNQSRRLIRGEEGVKKLTLPPSLRRAVVEPASG